MKSVLVAQAAESHVTAGRALGLDVALGGQHASRGDDAPAIRQRDLADSGARILVVAPFSFIAVRLGADFRATGRLTGFLLLASEALFVVLTVFRRAPAAVDRSMRARL